jgi:hypothetical protein
MGEATRIPSPVEHDEPCATDQLLSLVYDELRRPAALKLAREKPGLTLQATALVHEAYARLMGSGEAVCREQRCEQEPQQWPAFVERACAGDVLLRCEVEKLLRAQMKMGSFHEAARSALPATVEYPTTEGPGTIIGPYKLLEQIGEGGFGVVFMAQQEQ